MLRPGWPSTARRPVAGTVTAMPTWYAAAALIARNATHLSEADALRLIDTAGATVVDSLAGRADLTDTVVRALLEVYTSADTAWGLSTLAGNAHLSSTAQREIVAALLDAGRSIEPETKLSALMSAAKVVTDREAIDAIVRRATTGRVPARAWEARAGSDYSSKVPSAMAEHAMVVLVERGDVDDALDAAGFLTRALKRLPAEAATRGGLSSSPLREALHEYGMRHRGAYEQGAVASGDLLLLHPLSSRDDLEPATVAHLNRAVQAAIVTAATNGTGLHETADEILYFGWSKNIDRATKTMLRDALDAGTLTTGRRDWFRASIAAQERAEREAAEGPTEPATERWAQLAPGALRPALDREAWKLSHDELRVLWSRTDLPDGLSLELLRCGNPIGYGWAPALRPQDRSFAIALYTRCPGMLPEDFPLPDLRQVVIGLVRDRSHGQYAKTVTDSAYYPRLGALKFSLPADVALALSSYDKELATHLADQLAGCLSSPIADLLPSLVEGLDAEQPLSEAAAVVTAAVAA